MRHCLLVSLFVSMLGSAAQAEGSAESAVPLAAPGWSMSLSFASPEIVSPSSMVAPRGGPVYLGLERTRDSGPTASILGLKDGRVWRFAEDLGRVRGLEWADGTLYVIHETMLSALRDTDGDGRADQRTLLVTGLGPKAPAAPGLDELSASGVRQGMEGRLYVAVGDRGIFHAVGSDGQTIQLQGGGVIRVCPDGTGLEVVSTGEKNPRSVMFDSSGELFTIGSGNSSGRWPGGLTHHIVGGHYGYPYQFLVAPFRALPVIGGEVGEAVVQAVCYLEDGLPDRYRGNIFSCDEARQSIVRWEIRRSGGTFAIASRTEIVTKGDATDFRPVAIEPVAGGSGFWVVDRGPSSNTTNRSAGGRLYRLVYEGPDRVQPGPTPRLDNAADRIAALDHPARSVRLAAQRSLAREGASAVPLLIHRLKTEQPETGRIHALWALDGLDHDGARLAIREALRDRSPRVRLQAARSRGIHADRLGIDGLTALLADGDPAVRREAAIALGRAGNHQALEPLVAALADPDRFAAWSIRTAIRRLGYPASDPMQEALIDPKRRESALMLADEAYCEPVVEALVGALMATKEPAVRARMVVALAGQYRKYPEWTGAWWGPDPLAAGFPRKTLEWDQDGMNKVLEGLRQGLADGDASVRFPAIIALGEVGPAAAPILRLGFESERDPRNQEALVEAMGSSIDGESVRLLNSLMADSNRSEQVRTAALDALARFRSPDVLRSRLSLLYDPSAPEALVARALPSLARDGVLPLNDLAGFFDSPSPLIRASALMSLNVKKALPAELKERVLARLDDPSEDVRRTALFTVGAIGLREAVPRLIQEAGKPDAELRAVAISALCRMPDPRAAAIYRQAISDSDPSLSRAGEKALQAIQGRVDTSVARASGLAPGPGEVENRRQFAVTHVGDSRKGEAIFFENQEVGCTRCHAVLGRGSKTPGPDLGGLAARYDKARIIGFLLDPPPRIATAHRSVKRPVASLTPIELTDLITFLQKLRSPANSPERSLCPGQN